MDTKEMMNNEEVMETVEGVMKNSSKTIMTVAAGVGIAAVGFVTYKYAIKPLVAKVKSRKESSNDEEDGEVCIEEVTA